MKHYSKSEVALNFTKYSINLIRCWPPSRNCSKFKKLLFEISWWFMFISSLCLLFPLMGSVYVYRDNFEIMSKSIVLSCAVSQCDIKMLFCKIRKNQLQNLLEEIEYFIKYSNKVDTQILEKYISQCTVLHVVTVIWVYLTTVSFIIGPLLINRPFPTDAVYPFPIDNTYVKVLIYAHQSLVGFQTSAGVLFDSLVAAILWFTCARFEILGLSIRNFTNYQELKSYIKNYQLLLRYTKDVKNTINVFVFFTILTSTAGAIFCAIQLVADQPLATKIQSLVSGVTAYVGLFMCSWAADTLLQMEYIIGINAFQSNWYKMDKKTKSCILHVIALSQKPIIIRPNSIFPALSLTFYSQLITTSFKFFATLRIFVN